MSKRFTIRYIFEQIMHDEVDIEVEAESEEEAIDLADYDLSLKRNKPEGQIVNVRVTIEDD